MDGGTVLARTDGALVPASTLAQGGVVWGVDLATHQLVPRPLPPARLAFPRTLVHIQTSGAVLTLPLGTQVVRPTLEGGLEAVAVGQLRAGDRVASALALPEPVTAPLRLYLPKASPTAHVLRLPEYLTPDLAYFLGYTCGDGGVARMSGQYPQRLQWCDLDRDQVQVMVDVTRRLFRKAPVVATTGAHKGTLFTLNSVHLGTWMKANFPDTVVAGAHNRALSPLLTQHDNAVLAAALAGLYDAEGSCLRQMVSWASRSPVLAHQMVLGLRRLGVQATLTCELSTGYKTDWYYRVFVSAGRDLRRFTDRVGFRHPTKLAKLGQLEAALDRRAHQIGQTSLSHVPVPFAALDRILTRHRIPGVYLSYYLQRRWKREPTVHRAILESWIAVLRCWDVSEAELAPLTCLAAYRWDTVKSVRIDHASTRSCMTVRVEEPLLASGVVVCLRPDETSPAGAAKRPPRPRRPQALVAGGS